MAKIALISDIHANYEALKVVFRLIDSIGVDGVICAGDIVDYGPEPALCIQSLKDHKVTGIIGNHDAAVIGDLPFSQFPALTQQSLAWTEQVLSEDEREYLQSLPKSQVLTWGMVIHGSPHDTLWHYVKDVPAATLIFRFSQQALHIVGHTHIPGAFCYTSQKQVRMIPARVGSGNEGGVAEKTLEFVKDFRYIVNPGSVGQPRDGDPRASFAIVTLNEAQPESMTWYRVPYDAELTRKRVYDVGLPSVFGDRLLVGK